jgi:hypothetical protein
MTLLDPITCQPIRDANGNESGIDRKIHTALGRLVAGHLDHGGCKWHVRRGPNGGDWR